MTALTFPTSPTSGQIFTSNSRRWVWDGTTWVAGAPGGTAFMGAKAVATSTQSIPNNTATAVLFDSETSPAYDTNSIHSISTNTSRFVVPVGGAGKWAGQASLYYAANTSNIRIIWWRLNGTTGIPGSETRIAGLGVYGCALTSTFTAELAEGDYVELLTYQDSGGALNIGVSGGLTNDSSAASVWKIDGVKGDTGATGTTGPTGPTGPAGTPAFMGASVRATSTQSITTGGSGVVILFDSEASPGYDTDAIHSTVTNTGRFTIPVGGDGKWSGIAGIGFAAGGANFRQVCWRLNGVNLPGGTMSRLGDATYPTRLLVPLPPILLVAGDYLDLVAYQDSGSSINIGSATPGAQDISVASVWKIDGVKGDTGATGPGAGAMVGAGAYNSTTQSIPNATPTALTLDSEIFDTSGIHSTSSNTSRFTVPAGGDGYYAAVGNVVLGLSGGFVSFRWYKNGAVIPGSENTIPNSASTLLAMQTVQAAIYLVAGDYLEMYMYQTSGSTLAIGSATNAYQQTTGRFWKIDGVKGDTGATGATGPSSSLMSLPATGIPSTIYDAQWSLLDDSTLRVKVKGSDSIVRYIDLPLST